MKKFTITCNSCGSINCEILDEIKDGYEDGEWWISGHYMQCLDCSEENQGEE